MFCEINASNSTEAILTSFNPTSQANHRPSPAISFHNNPTAQTDPCTAPAKPILIVFSILLEFTPLCLRSLFNAHPCFRLLRNPDASSPPQQFHLPVPPQGFFKIQVCRPNQPNTFHDIEAWFWIIYLPPECNPPLLCGLRSAGQCTPAIR